MRTVMRTPRLLVAILFMLSAALCANIAAAQGLTLQIVNGVPSAIPITVVPFGQQGSGPAAPVDVAQIVGMDLARCGKFRPLPTSEIVQSPTTGAEIKFATWQQLKQDYILVGTTTYSGGVLTANYQLWDVNKQQMLLQGSMPGQGSDLRRVGHKIADQIYQKIIGVRGAFDTRIAYVTMVGLGNNAQYALVVADSDGYNPQTVVRSHEALLSPAWSPDGKEIAYVSFESGNSAIYIQNIATGARRLVSSRPGINGAPRFSPDGTRLAVSLSFQGNPEIYVLDLGSGGLTRLTHNLSIDTEPRWMPDGQNIIFTSDRSGKPQLYQIPATGGTPQRITFQGQYNANASISYDGQKLAMVQGNGNVYRIAVMDRSTGGQEIFVSPGNLDDSPSWAPNASMLLYAATEGPRGVLYSVSADGRVRQRLVLSDGDVREPAWGPYRNP
ncbi:MAG: Tol-Pal system beta propeller repeat protein TolB [Rhodanobacteraceae bacterium]|nr:MAG: Tol-Pal system beta propeller repeat protein TolB [Rhodanobacteraceae bacterium]